MLVSFRFMRLSSPLVHLSVKQICVRKHVLVHLLVQFTLPSLRWICCRKHSGPWLRCGRRSFPSQSSALPADHLQYLFSCSGSRPLHLSPLCFWSPCSPVVHLRFSFLLTAFSAGGTLSDGPTNVITDIKRIIKHIENGSKRISPLKVILDLLRLKIENLFSQVNPEVSLCRKTPMRLHLHH